ncbi:MAG: phosphotransferase enzyme family protein [Planctomycetota bacterium]|jgi:Ser/Thr protein kinase RdoA (MazF antagonist)
MEAAVRALHDDALVARIAGVVGVAPVHLESLGGFESFVYDTTVAGQPRIVKATWHGRRTPEQIGAEIDFVNFLADGGAPVCRTLPLADGSLVCTVPAATGAFHVYTFEKAPGAILERKERTDEHWIRWGALVGSMHRLSARYPGPPPPLARPTWEEEYDSIERIIADDPVFLQRFRDTIAALRELPREAGAYGAIHTDLHSHNIFWHDGEPRVFDFDDMLEFWFVSDLAIVLYYALLGPVWHADDRQADFDQLRDLVLRGYRSEHALPEWSYEVLPHFFALREQTLRAVILRSIPEAERTPPWQRFFVAATERIRAGRPPLDLSF